MSGRYEDAISFFFQVVQRESNAKAHHGPWEDMSELTRLKKMDEEKREYFFEKVRIAREGKGHKEAVVEAAHWALTIIGDLIAEELLPADKNTHSCSCRVHEEAPSPRESTRRVRLSASGGASRVGTRGDAQTGRERSLREGDIEC